MAKIVVEEQKELSVLPADSIVHLKVDEIDLREVNGARGTWEKLEFKFIVRGIQVVGDGSPVSNYDSVFQNPMWGSVPFRLTESPENKLRLWAEAILGMELGVGFELDTDLLLNRECRGITSQYTRRNGKVAHQIESLLPKGAPAAAAPQQNPWTGQPSPAAPAPTQQGFSFATPPAAGQAPVSAWGADDAAPF